MAMCYLNVKYIEIHLIKFGINWQYALIKVNDGYHGIEGTKRRKQNELLIKIALLYLCFQLLMKSLAYFVTSTFPTSFNKVKLEANSDGENVAESNEISMIRLN